MNLPDGFMERLEERLLSDLTTTQQPPAPTWGDVQRVYDSLPRLFVSPDERPEVSEQATALGMVVVETPYVEPGTVIVAHMPPIPPMPSGLVPDPDRWRPLGGTP